MKIGVIADTHIPTTVQALPESVFELFQEVELILHAGDIVELSVLEELGKLAPVEAVFGNMDSPEVRSNLPEKKILELGKFRVGMIHGKYHLSEQQDRICEQFDDVDLIIFGHSHRPFWGRVNGVYLLNPGSATDYIHTSENSVALLELGDEPHAEIVTIQSRQG